LGERRATKPEKPRLETAQFIGRSCLQGGDRSALDEDLLAQSNADGLARGRVLTRRRIPTLDGFDGADFVAWTEKKPISDFDRAGFDASGQNAPLIKSINILD